MSARWAFALLGETHTLIFFRGRHDASESVFSCDRFNLDHSCAAQCSRPNASGEHDAGERPAGGGQSIQAATQSSSTEIDTAKLAMKQSHDKDVTSFARHMMMDHTKLTVQLKMAAPHGVAVPKDNSDESIITALKPLKGKEFNTMYIKQVGVEGHQKAVAAFEKEAQEGQNADLKKAAQKALPTIQEHLKMAQELAAKKGVQ